MQTYADMHTSHTCMHTYYTDPQKDLKIGQGCVTQALVNRTVANSIVSLVYDIHLLPWEVQVSLLGTHGLVSS